MAKKRGGNPLGNAPGAQEAQVVASKVHLAALTQELSLEVKRSGKVFSEYLKDEFGLTFVGEIKRWQLASGALADFQEINLNYEQVRDTTFVNFDINGREQGLLTPESLADLNSLAYQQFYPAVGREINGQIEVLDGSRRRAWFLLQRGKVEQFRIIVTQNELEFSDAKALAKQLQTAKEHNLREIGLQCLAIQRHQKGLTQAEIAKRVGLSQAGVSKAIKAASIDERLIRLFPVVNLLSHPDYILLDKVMKSYVDEMDFISFIKNIEENIVNIQAEYSAQEQKEQIISAIKKALKLAEKKQNSPSELTDLVRFDTPGVFARKRVKGRQFSYEFSRLPKNIQKALDKAILDVLKSS